MVSNKVLIIAIFLILTFFVILVERGQNWNWKQDLLLEFMGTALGVLCLCGIPILIKILFKVILK
ncbi:hypothetical protein EXM63_02525 [Clostridium botulinum]|uniref:Uncharacterized protein n=1 Tax=Clostridium botulinum TaxID=1491 RepID=A0A6M0SZE1_CLOBO|nr:hypothetical protein [Clostridium botulinum]NFI74334.1 hypothetical protein [Clostridium sporogenes]NFP62242.1 hypothetical protein [Clostridium sporogenes]NFU95606.1 hypothetical protein [Clostridium sporogenes]NFV67939.1 hypothetical protein [Clostridium botulinum]